MPIHFGLYEKAAPESFSFEEKLILAKKCGKKSYCISGCVIEEAEACNNYGTDAFFPIVRGITALE